jgi:hypothetical protein
MKRDYYAREFTKYENLTLYDEFCRAMMRGEHDDQLFYIDFFVAPSRALE